MNIGAKYHKFLLENLEYIHQSDQIKQIVKVLRHKIHDRIIGIHEGSKYLLQIVEITEEYIKLQLLEKIAVEISAPYTISAYIPILKGDKLDLCIQKCTELGINHIYLMSYQYNVKQLSNWQHQTKRLQKIISEAVEQSERLYTPVLYAPSKLSDIKINPNHLYLSCLERSNNINHMSNIAKLITSAQDIHIFTGTEGGFSIEESQWLKQNTTTLSLGEYILRAETALISIISIIQWYKQNP